MSKTLKIEASVALPADVFEEATIIAKAKAAVDAFKAALGDAVGEHAHTLHSSVEAPKPARKPRAAKAMTAPVSAAISEKKKAA